MGKWNMRRATRKFTFGLFALCLALALFSCDDSSGYKVTVYDNVDNVVLKTAITDEFTIPSYTKTGYTYYGLTDGTYTYTAGSMILVKSDLTLTTVWRQESCLVTITGLYDGSEASADISESYDYGTVITVGAYKRSDYVYKGLSDGTKLYKEGSEITLKTDLTLTAVWAPVNCTVTVTGLYSGSDAVADEVTAVDYGDTFTINSYERDGYYLIGFSDGKGNIYTSGTELVIDDDLTLTAEWTQGYQLTINLSLIDKGTGEAVSSEDYSYYELQLDAEEAGADLVFSGVEPGYHSLGFSIYDSEDNLLYSEQKDLILVSSGENTTYEEDWTLEFYPSLSLEFTVSKSVSGMNLFKYLGSSLSSEWDLSNFTVYVDGEETEYDANSITAAAGSEVRIKLVGYQVFPVFHLYGLYVDEIISAVPPLGLSSDEAMTALYINSSYYSPFRSTYLETIPSDLLSNNTQLTDMSYAFYNCTALTSIPEGLFDGCTAATDFSYCFYKCTALEELPDLLFEGCASATDFSYCFYGCTALGSLPKGLFFRCTSATDFSYCFYGCTSLESISEYVFYRCKAATDFSYCFHNCKALTELPEGLFASCVSAINFSACFSSCTSLASLPEDLFAGCSSVTNFSNCFSNCTSLASLPEGLFEDCTAVTTFAYCFYNCSSLASLPEGLFEDCTAVTTFAYCFYSCSSLTSLPEGLFDSCTAVTTFAYCFYSCNSLKSIPLYLFLYNTSVTNLDYTFYYCSRLTPKVYIGSSSVRSCSYFARYSYSKGYVYVPSGSTTYTYFNRSSSYANVYVYTY